MGLREILRDLPDRSDHSLEAQRFEAPQLVAGRAIHSRFLEQNDQAADGEATDTAVLAHRDEHRGVLAEAHIWLLYLSVGVLGRALPPWLPPAQPASPKEAKLGHRVPYG